MGDSDDEYDRRRRDKFRGERNDYDNRRPPPRGYSDQHRGRGDRNSGSWERGTKRDYFGRDQSINRDRRENFGGRSSPPFKKTKKEWEGDQPWKGQDATLPMTGDKNLPAAPNAPVFMTFKDFIIQQEDNIDENEAVRRYQEYKVEFKRTQINDFFVLHKGEEWFEEKYHPVKSIERRNSVRQGLRKRLRLFVDLQEQGILDNVKLTITNDAEVLKLLDKAVVKLDGGTDEDMKALDLPPPPKVIEEGEEPKTEENSPQESITLVEDDPKLDNKKYNYNADGNDEEDGDPSEPLPPGIEPDDEVPTPEVTEGEMKPSDGDNDEENKGEGEKKSESAEYVYDGSHVKRPYSLFMRMVAACITRADLEAVCKRYPGYLRIAMSDASSERRYARRAWASFDHTVNIKDICWNISNIRIKDMELNPIVNRDVSNRVRSVNGITCSPVAMQLDMNFLMDFVKKLDEKHELYVKSVSDNGTSNQTTDPDTAENEEDTADVMMKQDNLVLPDVNPVMSKFPGNISEMVSGITLDSEEDDKKDYPIIVNEELEHFLDLLLLYLRLVHCIDYYNATDYMNEDEMPMRMGIMHVRAAPLEAGSKKDAHEWHTQTSSKLELILKDEENADDSEADKLGKKNEEEEVENFIKANTQELAKDKWLCPLTGKKFRGPEFIRKHILMKHTEHVDNVRAEVKYFNNYIYDLKRPCFPDPRAQRNNNSTSGGGTAPGANASPIQSTVMRPLTPVTTFDNRSRTSMPNQSNMYPTPRPQMPSTNYPITPQGQDIQDTYGRVNTYPPKAIRRGGGHRGDYRKLIKYRDLDAPEENDFF